MTKKTFYNEELNTTEEYSEVWKYELMRVKDISDLIVHNHYWKDSRGELWLDFDDPNENCRKAFNAYRNRKGFMQPNEIKKLRENLHLSQRVFSERLGISYAKVSQIENNKRVQTLSQEVSFRKAQQDYEKQGFLTSYDSDTSDSAELTKVLTETEYVDTAKYFYKTNDSSETTIFKVQEFVGGVA